MRRKHWPRHSGGLGLGLGVGGGGVGYLLNDSFLTDKAAGSVDGTAAEPGPGTRHVYDPDVPNNRIAISGGNVLITGQNSSHKPFLYEDSFARVFGKMLISDVLTPAAGSFQYTVGWAGLPTTGSFAAHGCVIINNANTINAKYGASNFIVGAISVNKTYQLCLILKPVGTAYFIKGGTEYPFWTLLYIEPAITTAVSVNTTPSYPCLHHYTNTIVGSHDKLKHPIANWYPTPQVSCDLCATTGDIETGVITASCYDSTSGRLYYGDATGGLHFSDDNGVTDGGLLKQIGVTGDVLSVFIDANRYVYFSVSSGTAPGLYRSDTAHPGLGSTWTRVLNFENAPGGLGNIGGYVWGIDQSTDGYIYAGHYGTGAYVFKSTDSTGTAFGLDYTAVGYSHVHRLIVDKSNDNVYITCGDINQQGIFKYTKLTTTWAVLPMAGPNAASQFVGIVATATARIFGSDTAIAADQGIWRTDDDTTLTQVYKEVGTACYGIRIDPDTGYIYAPMVKMANAPTNSSTIKLLVSTDDGLSFHPIRQWQGIKSGDGVTRESNIYGSRIQFSLIYNEVFINATNIDLSGNILPTTNGKGTVESSKYAAGYSTDFSSPWWGGTGFTWTDRIGTWSTHGPTLDGGLAISTIDSELSDIYAECQLIWSAGQVGNVWRYIDANNYLYSYHDGTNIALIQVLAGNPSNIVAPIAKTLSTTGRFSIRLSGRTAYLMYNDAAVGSGTINAAFDNITNHGLFTTDIKNSHLNFTIYPNPVGTNNPYGYLDMFYN